MKILKIKLIVLIVFTLWIQVLGHSQKGVHEIPNLGGIKVPDERTINWQTESELRDSILGFWASKTVEYGAEKGKVDNPRILLARLHLGANIQETNQLILGMTPWGISGSSWFFNKRGDYDFTLTVLTTILWQFGDKPSLLDEKTVAHLLDVLLIEEGGKFRSTAPKTLRLFPETENHLLMTEGSRYLKNRWLSLHGNTDSKYDNIGNKMETKILELLHEIKKNGLYEFNSMPYIGYTITALLNLEAFASNTIKKEARDVLDYMNFCYAIGSYNYKHFPPMRRRYDRADWHKLTTDYHSVFMKTWMSFLPGAKSNFDIENGEAHAIIAACMSYRPADKITPLLFEKEKGYFVKLGHGKKACPEIYAAGKSYLLSAGGVNRRKKSQIVTRPITLFINDDAKNLAETFHLSGPGTNFMDWNNTGVYKEFACAAGPVSIPDGRQPIFKSNSWSIYAIGENLNLAVFSSDKLGIMTVFENEDPERLAQNLEQVNPDTDRLKSKFQFPNGSIIQYDLKAPKNKWVITHVNNVKLDREFDTWALFSGDF